MAATKEILGLDPKKTFAVDRKVLADIAVTDPEAFTGLVEVARKALPTDVNAPAA